MLYRIFERLFVIALLLSGMGVTDAIMQRHVAGLGMSLQAMSADKAPPATRLAVAGIYVWGAMLITMRYRRMLHALCAAGPLFGFAALALLSTLWSVDPSATLRRSVFLLVWTVLGIYLGERYSIEQLARLLAQTLCLTMIAVLILHFVAPASIIDNRFVYADAGHRGAWKGLSLHKNDFGSYMALAIVVLLFVNFRRFRAWRFIFVCLAAVLLLLSRSATSILLCTVMVTAVALVRLSAIGSALRRVMCVTAAFAIIVGSCIASTWPALIPQLLGRDATLTGRTQVWSLVLHAVGEHPVLGYGYASFWGAPKGETLGVWLGAGFLVRDAANGYLDVCLAFGILGLPVLLYIFVYYLRCALDYRKTEQGALALWPVTYLCFFALHNVFESSLMDSWRSLPFLMLAAVGTSLVLTRNNCRQYGSMLHTPPQLRAPGYKRALIVSR